MEVKDFKVVTPTFCVANLYVGEFVIKLKIVPTKEGSTAVLLPTDPNKNDPKKPFKAVWINNADRERYLAFAEYVLDQAEAQNFKIPFL